MARGLTPDQIAQKWATNLANSTNNIRAGVLAVRTSPTERAAQRADAYVQGVQQAVQSGRWQAGLRQVTLQMWQDAMIRKGLPIIADRARQAIPAVTQFMLVWLQWQEQFRSTLEQMPRGNLEQNIARAVAVIRHNAEFKEAGRHRFRRPGGEFGGGGG